MEPDGEDPEQDMVEVIPEKAVHSLKIRLSPSAVRLNLAFCQEKHAEHHILPD